jgi:hypothetical protein
LPPNLLNLLLRGFFSFSSNSSSEPLPSVVVVVNADEIVHDLGASGKSFRSLNTRSYSREGSKCCE